MGILDKISDCGKSIYYVNQEDYDELTKTLLPPTKSDAWVPAYDLGGNLKDIPGTLGMYDGTILIDNRKGMV